MFGRTQSLAFLRGVFALTLLARLTADWAAPALADVDEIVVPPLTGEVSKTGSPSGHNFPDDALRPIEAPAPATVLLAPVPSSAPPPAQQVDPNSGPLAEEALARGHHYFARGTKLLVPDGKDDIVETPFGNLHIARDAVVLLVCSASSLAIFDLHDDRKHAIWVERDGKILHLRPGYAFIIANASESEFIDVNPAYFALYRGVTMTNKVLPDLNVFEAEFHIASLIAGFPALKSLADSPDPARRKVMASLLKTAAIMSYVSQSTDQYKRYIPQRILDQLQAQQKK